MTDPRIANRGPRRGTAGRLEWYLDGMDHVEVRDLAIGLGQDPGLAPGELMRRCRSQGMVREALGLCED